MIRYGLIDNKLIAIPTSNTTSNQKLVKDYDVLFVLEDNSVEQLLSLVINAAMLGVEPWRVSQIIAFYSLSDEEFMQYAKRWDLKFIKDDDDFIVEGPVRPPEGQVRIRTKSIFFGIVQALISMGYHVHP